MRKYILDEYSDILGPDQKQMKGNKYYQNHLKALEMMHEEEQQLKEAVKAKILQSAAFMQYNDDFDEEDQNPRRRLEVNQKAEKK